MLKEKEYNYDYYKIINPVSDQNFISDVDTISNMTDIKELEKGNSFIIKAYPNPTNDFCNIQFEDNLTAEISLTDQNGRLLYNNKYMGNNYKLDLRSYKTGIYSIRFYFPEYEETQIVKVIKK